MNTGATSASIIPAHGSASNSNKPEKKKPSKALPTPRINFKKQLEILRVYAIASGPNSKVVGNKTVAEIVKMDAGTTTMANPFFVETGFLQRAEGGFVPAPEVFSFMRAHEWNPETASQKLAPLVASSWFGEALLPRLEYRALDEKEVINNLADLAAATPEYAGQLKMLVDFMEAAGLIQREGTMVKAVKGQSIQVEKSFTMNGENQPSRTAVSTVFSQPADGIVQFNVSVKVDMKEFSGWAPERITAFFGGIAQVLAAKGSIEQGAADK